MRKHETQSYRESFVFHSIHFELYFALHPCVLSTFQQHLLQFPTINLTIMFPCSYALVALEIHDYIQMYITVYFPKLIYEAENYQHCNKRIVRMKMIFFSERI